MSRGIPVRVDRWENHQLTLKKIVQIRRYIIFEYNTLVTLETDFIEYNTNKLNNKSTGINKVVFVNILINFFQLRTLRVRCAYILLHIKKKKKIPKKFKRLFRCLK